MLRAIDSAVQFPILFELNVDGLTQVVACYKRPSEANASRWGLSDYFESGWLPADGQRAAMPLALDLASLYEQLLHRLIPLQARPQEPLFTLVERVEQVQALQRETARSAARLESEKQFNRKVDINKKLRTLKEELERLKK